VWIHASAERQARWNQERRECKERGLVLKKPSDTRWLSVEHACAALLSSLVTTARTLNGVRDNDAVAKSLLHNSCNVKFLTLMLCFCDVLPFFGTLSKTFQREDVDISMIEPRVQATKTAIENQIEHKGMCLLWFTCFCYR